jgi:hypothetical protein
LEPLDRRVVNRIVEQHQGNRGVGGGDGAWTCQRHLKALLFAQLSGLKSLREIVEGLAAQPAALYHLALRPPKRTTLSDASAARPAAVFGEIADHLMARMGRGTRQEGEALIRLLDASPIPLRDPRFDWAEADARCRGLKLHMLYDPREACPVRFAVTSPKVADIAEGREMPLEQGATYVFDKGYTDYAWWFDIVQAEALFITRIKTNAKRRDIRPNPAEGEAILADRRLKIGHKKPRGGAENPLYDTELREIVVARPDKPPLHLVTNDHHRSAAEIAGLYRQRWQIELFFKWIKQNLKIKKFLGTSPNAVRIQIITALIAYLLIRLAQIRAKSALSLQTLVRLVRVNLMQRKSFHDLIQAPYQTPPPTHPQLSLALAHA